MILSRSLTSAACLLGLTCVAAAQTPVLTAPHPASGMNLPVRGIDVPQTVATPTLVPPTTETLPQPAVVPQGNTAPGNQGGVTSGGDFVCDVAPGQYVNGLNGSGYGVYRPAPLAPVTDDGYSRNAGAHLAVPPPLGLIAPQAYAGGLHERFPYYSYRRPWYTPGPASLNVTIVW